MYKNNCKSRPLHLYKKHEYDHEMMNSFATLFFKGSNLRTRNKNQLKRNNKIC
ncbi:hypothetical protein SPRA44_550007 [Serratia proteamaculans]|nr:hypothetical protein SPRA44_550007 [Serratia proteamaculans]